MLTGDVGTVACTLTLTVRYNCHSRLIDPRRKFLSLVVSILYFQNPFTVYHWVGSLLVFLGGVLYVLGKPPQQQKHRTTKHEKQKIH